MGKGRTSRKSRGRFINEKIFLTKVREILDCCERKTACLEVAGAVKFEFRFR